ncbi:morphogenic membrane protein MmpA [Streptomyces griseosporeus]|uniref:morphogenic membrane protein MmpA n=1 Tax=Streptomyces griseosporeus TaxID=1910 RepID=UPI0036FADFBE
MTTHRAPARRSAPPLTDPGRPVERAVTAALVLAALAGFAWICGMVYTVVQWPR